MSDEPRLLSALIALNEGKAKTFTDIDLGQRIGAPAHQIPDLLKENNLLPLVRATKNRATKCPRCKKDVALASIAKVFCICGADVDVTNVPKWSYLLETRLTEQRLFDLLLAQFGQHGWRPEQKEETFCVLANGKEKIAVSLKLTNYFLSDYYGLKGWSATYGANKYVMLSFNFDFLVGALAQRKLTCTIHNVLETLKINFVEQLLKEIADNSKVAANINQQNEDILTDELREVEKGIETIFKELPSLALRYASMDEKRMGGEFQKRTIQLLNLAGIPAKPLGGNNMVDGAIFVTHAQTTRKPDFIGIDSKTFKSNGIKKYDVVTEASAQLRKYCAATQTEDFKSQAIPNSMVVVAYDFDTAAKGMQDFISAIKKDYGMEIVLFPLHALIHLVKRMRVETVHSRVPADAILKLFAVGGYVDITRVDMFVEAVENENKSFLESLIKHYRAEIKARK